MHSLTHRGQDRGGMTSTWGRTPALGSQTPMVGSMTPSYGSMTPMHGGGGGRTPMYGSHTPMHGDGRCGWGVWLGCGFIHHVQVAVLQAMAT